MPSDFSVPLAGSSSITGISQLITTDCFVSCSGHGRWCGCAESGEDVRTEQLRSTARQEAQRSPLEDTPRHGPEYHADLGDVCLYQLHQHLASHFISGVDCTERR